MKQQMHPSEKPSLRWSDFTFPGWVPEKTRKEIREFWAEKYQRGPAAWLENIRDPYNHHPALGALVECESMSEDRKPLQRGRWVPVWNNIGRVIRFDGTIGYSSTCGIRILPQRLQRLRKAGWRKPTGAIIVDRTSILGNPFSVAKYGADCAKNNYVAWLNGSHQWPELDELRERVLARIPDLRDKDLICFCSGDADWCHGMELIDRANR